MSVQVHIEHLVVDGLALEARGEAAFQAALTRELARNLEAHGLAREWAGGAAVPAVDGGTLRAANPAAPAAFGREAGIGIAKMRTGGGAR